MHGFLAVTTTAPPDQTNINESHRCTKNPQAFRLPNSRAHLSESREPPYPSGRQRRRSLPTTMPVARTWQVSDASQTAWNRHSKNSSSLPVLLVLGGSWVVRSRAASALGKDISRVTLVTLLITTHEPPSTPRPSSKAFLRPGFLWTLLWVSQGCSINLNPKP